jgi:hypothetical protein
MAKKPRKTASQEAAELMERKRKAFAAVGLSPEMADLVRNADVDVTRKAEKREGKVVEDNAARRMDAFDALKPSMKAERYVGCYDAARRYEHQILVRRGENDRGPSSERVDRTAGFTTDSMIDAARWVEDVNARLAPRDWWLLMELLSPTRDLGGWRGIVAHITGETHEHSQGAVVRAMTVNLRDAIEAVEKAATAARRAA